VPSTVVIRPISSEAEAKAAARMMADTEPWITLGFGYEACLARTSDPEKEKLGAVFDGQLAGFLILDMRGPFAGYIQTVCVDGPRRSHGIGSALIAEAEKRVRHDSPNVFLCVSATNERARSLYERLGFERIGEIPNYLALGCTEILMRKSSGPILDFRPAGSAR
jgi:[ribosomal protein S18]-alanine N-acetyltransferase